MPCHVTRIGKHFAVVILRPCHVLSPRLRCRKRKGLGLGLGLGDLWLHVRLLDVPSGTLVRFVLVSAHFIVELADPSMAASSLSFWVRIAGFVVHSKLVAGSPCWQERHVRTLYSVCSVCTVQGASMTSGMCNCQRVGQRVACPLSQGLQCDLAILGHAHGARISPCLQYATNLSAVSTLPAEGGCCLLSAAWKARAHQPTSRGHPWIEGDPPSGRLLKAAC